MTVAPRSVDPVLGKVRYCRRCDEWWPEDDEFWGATKRGVSVCRACQREWNRLAHERRLARIQRRVVLTDPEERGPEQSCACPGCSCPVLTPFGICRFCRRWHTARRLAA